MAGGRDKGKKKVGKGTSRRPKVQQGERHAHDRLCMASARKVGEVHICDEQCFAETGSRPGVVSHGSPRTVDVPYDVDFGSGWEAQEEDAQPIGQEEEDGDEEWNPVGEDPVRGQVGSSSSVAIRRGAKGRFERCGPNQSESVSGPSSRGGRRRTVPRCQD